MSKASGADLSAFSFPQVVIFRPTPVYSVKRCGEGLTLHPFMSLAHTFFTQTAIDRRQTHLPPINCY
eukprot:scaffold1965_cov110-Cylindrotheca_fusiformis.AAC.1